MSTPDEELDPRLDVMLASLRADTSRDPQKAALGRDRYLAELRKMPAPVSRHPFRRLTGWKLTKPTWISGKERTPMYRFALALTLALVLVFASGTATVLAAQDSLPNQSLYGVKLWSEDLRISTTSDPSQKVDLLTQYSDRRVKEITTLQAAGEPVPEAVTQRLADQMDQMMHITASMDDPEMSVTLAKIRIHLRDQDRVMDTTKQPDHANTVQATVQKMLQQQNEVVEMGITDPSSFRSRYQNGNGWPEEEVPTDTEVPTEEVTPTGGYGPGPNDAEPAQGPSTTPGDCAENPDCVPANDGSGPGPGPGGGDKNETPVPGRYGPGSDPDSGLQVTPTPAAQGNNADKGYQKSNQGK